MKILESFAVGNLEFVLYLPVVCSKGMAVFSDAESVMIVIGNRMFNVQGRWMLGYLCCFSMMGDPCGFLALF